MADIYDGIRTKEDLNAMVDALRRRGIETNVMPSASNPTLTPSPQPMNQPLPANPSASASNPTLTPSPQPTNQPLPANPSASASRPPTEIDYAYGSDPNTRQPIPGNPQATGMPASDMHPNLAVNPNAPQNPYQANPAYNPTGTVSATTAALRHMAATDPLSLPPTLRKSVQAGLEADQHEVAIHKAFEMSQGQPPPVSPQDRNNAARAQLQAQKDEAALKRVMAVPTATGKVPGTPQYEQRLKDNRAILDDKSQGNTELMEATYAEKAKVATIAADAKGTAEGHKEAVHWKTVEVQERHKDIEEQIKALGPVPTDKAKREIYDAEMAPLKTQQRELVKEMREAAKPAAAPAAQENKKTTSRDFIEAWKAQGVTDLAMWKAKNPNATASQIATAEKAFGS